MSRLSVFKSVNDVWLAIDRGQTVYCHNKSYKVYVESNIGNDETRKTPSRMFSDRNGQLLSVRCISNYFGSVISESDLNNLFIESED